MRNNVYFLLQKKKGDNYKWGNDQTAEAVRIPSCQALYVCIDDRTKYLRQYTLHGTYQHALTHRNKYW